MTPLHEDLAHAASRDGIERAQEADVVGKREHPLAHRHVREHAVDEPGGSVSQKA